MIGIIIFLENTYGNDIRSLRKHFKKFVNQNGPMKKLGLRRFELLRNCFDPPKEILKQLTDILVEESQKYKSLYYSLL